MKSMRKVSIKTIAEDLKLSRNTVSKALNDSDSVAYETRRAVIKRAIDLGYNKIDPALREKYAGETQYKKSVLIFAHRDISSFWDDIAFGIFDRIGKEQYNVLYNFISNEDEENCVIPANLMNPDVLGIILLDVFKREYVQKLLERKLPIVFLDEPVQKYSETPVGDIVIIEGFSSVYKLTSGLIHAGKRRIGFIGDITHCRTVHDRYMGFVQAMKDNGIPLIEEICLVQHMPERYYNYSEVSMLLDKLEIMPEAFVCCNDDVAMYVINYYRKKGCSIPDDIAVCGFDNKKEYSLMEPTLTTVEIRKNDLGCRLAQELLWRVDNMDMPCETVIVSTEIKYGDSFPNPYE
jgi:LacI family transcriptional regulator